MFFYVVLINTIVCKPCLFEAWVFGALLMYVLNPLFTLYVCSYTIPCLYLRKKVYTLESRSTLWKLYTLKYSFCGLWRRIPSGYPPSLIIF